MTDKSNWDIIIIGGGVAGLMAALHLSESGQKICLIEKSTYPNHKVCGEYVSNEVLPYLNYFGLDPFSIGAKKISKFEISNSDGTILTTELPLGGFGLSRYAFDNLLYQAIKDKIHVVFDRVESVEFTQDSFIIGTKNKDIFKAEFVVGSFGKRSNIDSFLGRKFMQENSPWLAVKGHYECELAEDKVSLHNFNGGYCGLSQTETGVVNACYLTTFKSFKKYGDIEEFQEEELSKNPFLKEFFSRAKPIFKKPLTISQISFSKKSPVTAHIFMLGDSAGLIHPLCGNGMAMGIKSAKIFSELYLSALEEGEIIDRLKLEKEYSRQWQQEFESRLKTGRLVQRLLLNPLTSRLGFAAAKSFPRILPKIIERTHGSVEA
ncbi:MAG TPA: FAD-dependent oxidoreductase [Aequorivita sp.]|nr:FAD-dependent oxidoreductase [Aequorivita sp.]